MKKSFALRLDPEVYDAVERWAADEFRSTNGQIEWLIADALKRAKRMPKPRAAAKRDLLLLLLCLGPRVQAQQWWQAYSPSTQLVLCLHLSDSTPQLYSPLQSPQPLPVSRWSLRADTLRLECASIGFRATLARRPDGWQATWRQGLLREELLFLPADTLFAPRRPQTPQPPFPYAEEPFAADYTDPHGAHVHLEGTLTLPPGGPHTRVPCLLLVSGSGQQNRDEELFLHRPFLVLADHLARRGIATLRYDDRGVGSSTGPLDSASTPLFAADAEALFRALRSHPRIDTARLGIGGHSEGGAIAPMVAARNPEVRFVVMLAGQGCTGLDVLVQQNEALFRARGVSPRLCRARAECMRSLLALPPSAPVADFQARLRLCTDTLTPAEADSIGLKRGMAHQLRQQLASPWMQAFLRLDPALYLPQVRCPLLALGGSLDCQVPPAPNLARIRQLCPQADCRELPGLNHLFQRCLTGSPDEYLLIEQTFAPEALDLLADWLLALP